eukprot:4730920-Pleurochrysis_carterae.AAC.1
MASPRWAARDASVRRDVARIVAQKANESSSRGNILVVNEFPAAVVCVVGNLGSLGGRPTSTIVAQSLFARLRVGIGCGRKEGASSVTSRNSGERGVAYGQESRGLSIAEWISTQAALKMFM